jgi:signal transduction histidine kinase/DNA-binding response OmpR family regulator
MALAASVLPMVCQEDRMGQPMDDRALPIEAVFAGGGEMGAHIRAHDWGRTPLGPFATWPQSLRTTVNIMLNSRYPMFLFWGPEAICLYNDGYRPSLGAHKHPRALGQRGRECWADIWHIIGPQIEAVMAHGEQTWHEDQLVPFDRNGYFEEIYFTYSYSPVHDESGGVGGTLVVCSETTDRVLLYRRLQTLSDLAARATNARDTQAAIAAICDTLAANPYDLPFALLYQVDASRTQAQLVGTVGIASGTEASPPLVALAGDTESCWPLAHVAATGAPATVEHLAEQFAALPRGPWPEPIEQAMVLPITPPGHALPALLLVAAASSRKRLDAAYRTFYDLLANQIAALFGKVWADEAERQRIEALAELDRAKTTFFNNVSHEFRTPLTLMRAPIDDLLSEQAGPLTDAQREYLQIVQRNSQRLLKLVNTMLDFAHMEAGRTEAVYMPTDLAALTADLASSFRSAMERAGLEFVVDCAPLPAPIYVDRDMWEKIVLNLLSNALKFTFAGTVRVELRWADGHAELTVSDSGAGIPADELPHLFERFRRLRTARARTHEGTGIGLALVHELVRLHGGTITATSAVGEGTSFRVRIPAGTAHLPADRISDMRALTDALPDAEPFVEEALRWLPADDTDDASSMKADAQAGDRPDGSAAHILIVEDNADLRGYLTRLLQRRGWTVTAVTSGDAARDYAHAQPPDLVLSDVMLPGMDGFALLHALRDDPITQTIPIILLSARAGEEARVEGLQAGADDYLIKPFSARELLARISVHLKLSQVRREAAHHEHALRQAAEHVASHLSRLQQLTAALVSALTPEQVASVVLQQGCAAIGASAGMLALLNADGSALDVVEAVGDAGAAGAWPTIALDAPLPLADAVRSGRVVLFETRDAARQQYPDLEAQPMPGDGALIALPLQAGEHTLGGLAFSLPGGHALHADEIEFLQSLAQQSALALERARLFVAEQQARTKAQDAVHIRDAFLSVAAHELKTPLTALVGNAQLLLRRTAQRETLDAREQRMVHTITEQARRLQQLIEALLDVSRLESGQLSIVRQPLDLAVLVRHVVDDMQPTVTHHTLRCDVPDRPLIMQGDLVRLMQVLHNLIGNAIKYSPDGGIITVRVTQHNSTACISVIDEGIGIPAHEIPHVFNQFYRAITPAGQNIQGMGVGLYVVREIVTLHGGTVTVESVEGAGSTFTICLPLDATHAARNMRA